MRRYGALSSPAGTEYLLRGQTCVRSRPSGRVPAGGVAGDTWDSWINPTSILGVVLAGVASEFTALGMLAGTAIAAASSACKTSGSPTASRSWRRWR